MENISKTIRYYKELLEEGKIDPDFFEFIRRVEIVSKCNCVGDSSNYKKEPVRFGQLPTLKFSETTIESITEKKYPTLFVNFLGLAGYNGPLPLDTTEFMHNRSHNHYDYALQRMNDIINHRFIGLFYRAWKANEMAVSLNQDDGGLIARILSALAGNMDGMKHMPEWMDIGFSGIMGNAIRSRDGLETILKHYYQTNLHVVGKVESVARIPKECRCRLGMAECSTLGVNTQLGSRYISCCKKIRIEVGPISYEEAKQKFHSADGLNTLKEILGAYLHRPMEKELQINLIAPTICFSRLNGSMRIGHDIWLHSKEFSSNPKQIMQL